MHTRDRVGPVLHADWGPSLVLLVHGTMLRTTLLLMYFRCLLIGLRLVPFEETLILQTLIQVTLHVTLLLLLLLKSQMLFRGLQLLDKGIILPMKKHDVIIDTLGG